MVMVPPELFGVQIPFMGASRLLLNLGKVSVIWVCDRESFSPKSKISGRVFIPGRNLQCIFWYVTANRTCDNKRFAENLWDWNLRKSIHFLGVGGGHLEDMTPGWPVNWTRAIRSSVPLLGGNKHLAHHSHSWSSFQGCSLEGVMCC